MKKNEYTKTCNYPADALKIPGIARPRTGCIGCANGFPGIRRRCAGYSYFNGIL